MDVKTAKPMLLPISSLEFNEGQIEGVPRNPRTITEERLEALKKSVSELPDMLSLRELLVYPIKDKYIVLCGNQRLMVCKELEWEKLPCKIIHKSTPSSTLRRIAMLDNEEFGKTDWDVIVSDWDVEELKDWGIEAPSFLEDEFELGDFFNKENEEKEEKGTEIKVVCPADFTDKQIDEVRKAVEEAVKNFEGLKIK